MPARARLDRVERGEHGLVAAAERAGQRLARRGDQPVLLGLRDFEAADLGLEVGEERAVRPSREGRAGEDAAAVLAHRREVEGGGTMPSPAWWRMLAPISPITRSTSRSRAT